MRVVRSGFTLAERIQLPRTGRLLWPSNVLVVLDNVRRAFHELEGVECMSGDGRKEGTLRRHGSLVRPVVRARRVTDE